MAIWDEYWIIYLIYGLTQIKAVRIRWFSGSDAIRKVRGETFESWVVFGPAWNKQRMKIHAKVIVIVWVHSSAVLSRNLIMNS